MKPEGGGAAPALRVLIVDDEAPARSRLRDLLGDIGAGQPSRVVGMAANGVEALRILEAEPADVVLADIRMPVMDGVELARHLGRLDKPPAVIFVTAYDQYAVQAFDLAAVDYLLKPVRAERLAAALGKLRPPARVADATLAGLAPGERRHFSVSERGRILLLPVADVLYLRAELKYVTARTAERDYVLDESLVQLEEEFPQRFLRLHRNCLVARAAVLGVERAGEQDGEAHWAVLLKGVDERLAVSRRQWPAVRQALGV
ncbi:LytR/AlgR family response regulator transcription factor [Thauera mechernichensis]|uniref:LytR/AlgR family response regulator transcription factor n=1 Tax=Thauera mechernichensis TaxID=82788 RepID=A0ABW3W9Z9_9RHOO|nr:MULTISPECIES: LytTR family DNA-binding domain-containing protein [Thauera]ENO76836.1 alginate biosynthesis regulatory protein AlgR [Thauera sp. 27]ENO93311.1 alginate biosynthesis regulatory protein AlgR [Thauera sp. 28]MDG3066834.1 LytTR family DNA-binding domain-containing protein [Thauera mechernichensis]WBL65289.1 LytTR family DNA-binding domain-containing protein [Thauera sp. WB-2]HNR61107.1 LytTR family DNA-binding domain-containing protein [Thauera sp.]